MNESGLVKLWYCENKGKIEKFLLVENNEGSCSPNSMQPHEMWERFTASLSSQWWKRPRGGAVGRGCGEIFEDDSFYFGHIGTRKIETKPLDTSRMR